MGKKKGNKSASATEQPATTAAETSVSSVESKPEPKAAEPQASATVNPLANLPPGMSPGALAATMLKPANQGATTSAAAAGKVKRAPLLDSDDKLMPNVSTALLEIFGRFDDDNDGALNRKELEAFAIATNGEKFEEEAVDELKKSFNVDANGNLTRRGFLEMYQLQTLSDPNETWRDLIKHGYSVKIQLIRRATGNADPNYQASQASETKEKGKKGKGKA